MLKLKFKINKYYLLAHALKQYNPPFKEWRLFEQRLGKKFGAGYYLFTWHPETTFMQVDTLGDLDNIFKEANKLILKALRSKEFQKLHQETKKYLSFVKRQWERNEEKSLKILKELSGLELPDKIITVYITHPKLYNGINFPEQNIIGWGHPEDWKNYTTVYLCHELLHILTHKKFKDSDSMHALIELITDNEIRIRLNKKGKYFKEGKFNVGHPFLYDLERKILPIWKKYLKEGKRNIYELEKEIIKKLKTKK